MKVGMSFDLILPEHDGMVSLVFQTKPKDGYRVKRG